MSRVAVCADVGSTYTKAAAVDLDTGELLATAADRTTVDTDILDGLDAVRAALATQLSDRADGVGADKARVEGAGVEEVLVCSSAGGGLRLAVVGYERAVTAEAGHRVGLSAGARVVHVAVGRLDGAEIRALLTARPDVVLLVGGTDGGNAEVLEHNAGRLARSPVRCPVVVAGNVEARGAVVAVLAAGGKTTITAANVLPRIGVLDPRPAREAIRDVFLRHVIGGKGLSRRGGEFAGLVRAATPDAVLAGVELLADGAEGVDGAGDVLVVDVGGATTDVYSVVRPDPEEAAPRREVVATAWRGRTVEGDVGMRWSAPGVVEAALAERLITASEAAGLHDAATIRAGNPGYLAPTADGVDERLAALAATVGCRRHARPQLVSTGRGDPVRRGGRDLRAVRLVVGSGGVLRHAAAESAARVLSAVTGDLGGGWKVPERPMLVVDRSYVLAAAGLLALAGRPGPGARLLRAHLVGSN